MPRDVASGFLELKSRVEITDTQAGMVSATQKGIRAAVAGAFNVADDFLTGSYDRSTMIAPLAKADVDIFEVLNSGYFTNKYSRVPGQLLRDLQTALKSRYPSTRDISANGQAVTIEFQQFSVDVVPAFCRQGSGFLIPDSRAADWIQTDPRVHATLLTTQNKAHDGLLVPVVKMVKAWNRQAGNPFNGFYLELMTGNALDGKRLADYKSAVIATLSYGIEAVKFQIKDPAGFGGYVNPLRSARGVEEAVRHFKNASDLAASAVNAEASWNTQEAFRRWKGIFGDYFPAYG